MTFEQDAETLRNACVGVRIVGGSHTAVEDALERVLLSAKRWQSLPENERRMLLYAQDLQDKDAHK